MIDDDPGDLLDRFGFDPDENVLTRRQATVLALRSRGVTQSEIATYLGTSRANVAGVESSARENLRKAAETVAFADALQAPVRVSIEEGTDLYDVPAKVYAACDEAGLKVDHTAPDLMKQVSDDVGDVVRGREVRRSLIVGVTGSGDVHVRISDVSDE